MKRFIIIASIVLLPVVVYAASTYWTFAPQATTVPGKTYSTPQWQAFTSNDSATMLKAYLIARGKVSGVPAYKVRWNRDSSDWFALDSIKLTTGSSVTRITFRLDSLMQMYLPDGALALGANNELKRIGTWEFKFGFLTDSDTLAQGGTITGAYQY